MDTDTRLEESGRQIADAIDGRTFGRTTVKAVSVRVERDSENEVALFLYLTLPNPPRRVGVWPEEDILALQEALTSAVRETKPNVNVYARMIPEVDEPQADDDNELLPE